MSRSHTLHLSLLFSLPLPPSFLYISIFLYVFHRLQSESDALRSELDSHLASTMTSEKEIEKAREDLKELNRENTERLRILGESLLLATETSEQSAKQMDFLKNDILKFQATARSAHSNYERELQLHAKAEKDLKDLETGTYVLQMQNISNK